jgi:5-methyltetrahydropteroyltriglutamate--homocysteine methyltransferase
VKRSTDGMLTTHAGSLSRPADLDQMLFDREEGKLADPAAFDARGPLGRGRHRRPPARAGVSVIGDGEMGKIGYSTYVKDRLTGSGRWRKGRRSLRTSSGSGAVRGKGVA